MAHDRRGALMLLEKLRWAHVAGRRLRILGAGTWSAAGRPVHAEDSVSLADQRGIVEYVAGDLTLTARAGTPLSHIVAATRVEGQWLPMAPWGGDDGTIGATVSTATAGPFAHAMGLPRDLVLGMEFVTGDASVVRCGGRVVKNVAGFDLTRLLVGSWGTLGVITEVTVRLRGLPERMDTLAIAVPTTRTGLNDLAVRLRQLPFTPIAAELVNDRLARRIGVGAQPLLLVRLGGNERSVTAQREQMRAFGDTGDVRDDCWDALRVAGNDAAGSWRWSQLPSLFGDTWTTADTAARALDDFYLCGGPARGVVRVVAPASVAAAPSHLVRVASAFRGTVVPEMLPVDAWPLVITAPAHALTRDLRAKFDPAGILNPGILD